MAMKNTGGKILVFQSGKFIMHILLLRMYCCFPLILFCFLWCEYDMKIITIIRALCGMEMLPWVRVS